jgi:stage II sporulation protein D
MVSTVRSTVRAGAVVLTLTAFASLQAQTVKVGLWSHSGSGVFSELSVSVAAGDYRLIDGEGNELYSARELKNSLTVLAYENQAIQVSSGEDPRLVADQLIFVPTTSGARIRTRLNGKPAERHAGALHIFPDRRTRSGGLRAVLEVGMEDYLPGVLSAESGVGHRIPYYAAQATVSRTYTVQAAGRHRMEGFDVCDRVHCQVYHGTAYATEPMYKGVRDSRGLVLVDGEGECITAAFHSNCGGHTQGAQHVWQRPLPYLQGVADTFCLAMPHSHWENVVARSAWARWLKKHGLKSDGITQWLPRERTPHLMDSTTAVRSSEARNHFHLRSAFFVAIDEGDSTRFVGQGFGHGIGLCQEGAMARAVAGHAMEDILHAYFKDVYLVKMSHLDPLGAE